MAYVNYYQALLNDLRTVLRTEFPNIQVLIGDVATLKNIPCIVLEPYDKDIDTESTHGKKDFKFLVYIWIYHQHNTEEQAVKLLTELAEQVEELLIDDKKYPTDSGTSWYNSTPKNVSYGGTTKGELFTRTVLLKWEFRHRVNK